MEHSPDVLARDPPTPIGALTAAFAAGRRSPAAELEAFAARIDRAQPRLNCFQHLDLEAARAAAGESAARWRSGRPLGPLDGVVVAVKDTLAVAGMPARHGSLTTATGPAAQDCPAVARLRAAGAIVIGKTTTPEFAWKALTDSRLAGVTRNPWNPAHTPGGSTGGGAAALAAGLCVVALGTDGGSSIRIPAAWCGLIGFKPTHGRIAHVPHGGLFGSLSSIGVLARSVGDLALVLGVLAGPDARDPRSLPANDADYRATLSRSVRGLRIAFAASLVEAEAAADAVDAAREALGPLERAGALVVEIASPVGALEPRFRPYWGAAMAAKLRTLGPEERSLVDPDLVAAATEGASVGPDALLDGHAARLDLAVAFAEVFAGYDLLATPTTPGPAPLADGPLPDRWRRLTPYTYPFNLTGQPAVSLPAGCGSGGLPLGLQLVAPRHGDAPLLAAAAAATAR